MTYGEEMDAQLRERNLDWWCRCETYRIATLLKTHVSLALESGTDPERVAALLERVKHAVLDTTPKETT